MGAAICIRSGIVAYQMLAGELPFNAPTVAGILMKQITETAPLLHDRYPDVPEDLSLAVSRCLEKDPANRWPSADALRRSLETRSVAGYRPTGLGWKAQTREPTSPLRTTPVRPSTTRNGRPPLDRPAPVRPVTPGRSTRPTAGGFREQTSSGDARRRAPALPTRAESRQADKLARREQRAIRREMNEGPLPETGEPRVIVAARRQFARFAATTGGCFLINIMAPGLHTPWFLFVAFGTGFGLLNRYSALWQAGYSWRDVVHRPDAPDAVGSGDKRPRIKGVKQIAEPRASEFGAYYDRMRQVYKDRSMILGLMGQLSTADKEMLPDIVETTEGLYARAAQLAETLGSMDSLGVDDTPRIDARLAELRQRPQGEERDRQVALLEQQRQRCAELAAQRSKFADRFESCVLAMQNVRLDLMRLKQSGVGAVINGLTMATQQARALSRDVDNAIDAAAEVKAL